MSTSVSSTASSTREAPGTSQRPCTRSQRAPSLNPTARLIPATAGSAPTRYRQPTVEDVGEEGEEEPVDYEDTEDMDGIEDDDDDTVQPLANSHVQPSQSRIQGVLPTPSRVPIPSGPTDSAPRDPSDRGTSVPPRRSLLPTSTRALADLLHRPAHSVSPVVVGANTTPFTPTRTPARPSPLRDTTRATHLPHIASDTSRNPHPLTLSAYTT